MAPGYSGYYLSISTHKWLGFTALEQRQVEIGFRTVRSKNYNEFPNLAKGSRKYCYFSYNLKQ
jgi:hypothetical protein